MQRLTLHVHVADDGLAPDLQVELGGLGQLVGEVQRADAVVFVHGERVVHVALGDGVARVVLEGGHRGQDLDDSYLGSGLFMVQPEDDRLVLVGQVSCLCGVRMRCTISSLLLQPKKKNPTNIAAST